MHRAQDKLTVAQAGSAQTQALLKWPVGSATLGRSGYSDETTALVFCFVF